MLFSFHIFVLSVALSSESTRKKKELFKKVKKKENYKYSCLTLLVLLEPKKLCMLIQYCLKIVLSFKHKRLKSLKDLRLQSLKYFLCCPGSVTVCRDELLHASVAMQPLWHPRSSNVSVLYFMHKMGRRAVSFGGFISIFSLLLSKGNLCRKI